MNPAGVSSGHCSPQGRHEHQSKGLTGPAPASDCPGAGSSSTASWWSSGWCPSMTRRSTGPRSRLTTWIGRPPSPAWRAGDYLHSGLSCHRCISYPCYMHAVLGGVPRRGAAHGAEAKRMRPTAGTQSRSSMRRARSWTPRTSCRTTSWMLCCHGRTCWRFPVADVFLDRPGTEMVPSGFWSSPMSCAAACQIWQHYAIS